jgi:photosystem II stability/assembly factor-like uncharacterized protein
MKTLRLRPLALLLAVGIAAGALAQASGTPAVRDVLDVPALRTQLADRGLLSALTTAGARIVAVGQRGHVLLSDDGGRSWQQAEVPVSSDLVGVHFPTPEQGWAVGHDGVILHSTDGGKKWQRQRDGRPDQADVPLLDVWFEDASNGYAVGAFGLALRTSDGGVHWEPLRDAVENPKNLHLYAVRGIAGTLYMAGEQGLLLKLDRASGRFVKQAVPYEGTLFGVTGNDRAIVAFGLRGNTVRSTDAGATWQKLVTGIPSGLTAGAVDAKGRILLAGQAGQLLASSDDGASFQPLVVDRPLPAAALLPTGASLLVAGPRGVKLQPLP